MRDQFYFKIRKTLMLSILCRVTQKELYFDTDLKKVNFGLLKLFLKIWRRDSIREATINVRNKT